MQLYKDISIWPRLATYSAQSLARINVILRLSCLLLTSDNIVGHINEIALC